MSDRAPNVKVQPSGDSGQWVAFCREPGCHWIKLADPSKTYVEQRARAHRAEHRKAVGRA